jgi:hypothetical protein
MNFKKARRALWISKEHMMTEKMTVEQWLAIRREAGLKIDPETAEVHWTYVPTVDPYCLDPDLPEEYQQVGREYFARSPGSDIWVRFGDLPEATRDALWEKHKRKLAFPAGLERLALVRKFGSPFQMSGGAKPERPRSTASEL